MVKLHVSSKCVSKSKGNDLKQGFEQRLEALAAAGGDVLNGGLKGVEKESLRITPDGFLSQSPHPAGLGSALTNRYITTDFSEALLEFVTPAFPTTWEALRCICDIHQFTYAHLGEELLWTASMPCRIPGDREIPLIDMDGKCRLLRECTSITLYPRHSGLPIAPFSMTHGTT
jgi:gamma-glutamylcysteine synthetase